MENYEQKYKESLERCKSWMKGEHPECFSEAQKAAEFIFPELRESEDERIRKGLIKGLSAMRDIHKHQTFSDDAININDAIAWLEKQGEQKPADKVEPKFEELTEFDYAVLSIVSDHNSHTDSIEAFAKRSSKKLLDLTRKELLKDLPKWKNINQVQAENHYAHIANGIINPKGYFISYDDLETLPKEE